MAITKLRQRGITDQAVGSTQIENSSVAAADIAPATITTTQIAPATIASSNIAPGTVAASNIAPGTITTTQISPAVPLGVPAVSSDPPTPSLSEGDLFFDIIETFFKLKTFCCFCSFSMMASLQDQNVLSFSFIKRSIINDLML